MRLSNIQSFNVQNQSFTARKRNRDYIKMNYNETLQPINNEPMYTPPKNGLQRRAAAVLAALALMATGGAGYNIGKNASIDEAYLAGYEDGVNKAIEEFEKTQQEILLAESTPTPFLENVEATPTPALTQTSTYVAVQTLNSEIPEKVQALAVDTLKEHNFTQKPYLFEDKSELPSYFPEYGIDRAVLARAQSNFARVFRSANYIIISPKHDTTMGEIKRVMGVADEVIGLDEANELKTREQIAGSNGNLDNAIVKAGDAIRIKYYDSQRGHVVGSYAIHKSNSSRKKIAESIVEWSQK